MTTNTASLEAYQQAVRAVINDVLESMPMAMSTPHRGVTGHVVTEVGTFQVSITLDPTVTRGTDADR